MQQHQVVSKQGRKVPVHLHSCCCLLYHLCQVYITPDRRGEFLPKRVCNLCWSVSRPPTVNLRVEEPTSFLRSTMENGPIFHLLNSRGKMPPDTPFQTAAAAAASKCCTAIPECKGIPIRSATAGVKLFIGSKVCFVRILF